MSSHRIEDLRQMQAYPLAWKIEMTKERIRAWCNAWKRYEVENLNTGRKRTEQDVLEYIKRFNVPICSVYGDIAEDGVDPNQTSISECGHGKLCTTGCKRTGCIFCMFGVHLEQEPNRFQMLKETHPRQYEYCIGGGEYVDGVWMPNKEGLGLGHVLDTIGVKY